MTEQSAHADRREPSMPRGAVDLAAVGADLLEEARGLSAGRSGRSLTPHLGADLKQTVLALLKGRALGKHPSPGPATIQVLAGAVTLNWDGGTLALEAGQWAIIPREPHDLQADQDAVVFLTVHAAPQG